MADDEKRRQMSLISLKNIGKTTETWLNEVGIHTVDVLRRIGIVEAYRRLITAYPSLVTLNALWSLDGALLGLDWAWIRLANHSRRAKDELPTILKRNNSK